MGVNCLMVDQYMESECRIQLPELVSRPGQNKPDAPEDEKKTWIENPSLHLTALYFMQELRKQKYETMPDELKEMQEEILADFTRGTYITAFQEGAGVPLLKQKNGDAYQPIFTDIIEFGKFNSKNQFKAIAVTADKIPSILVKEAKGVVVNPFINLRCRSQSVLLPNPEAAAHAGAPGEQSRQLRSEVKADSAREQSAEEESRSREQD
ncbi:MAG: SseB family protein [Clostridiaceae bacterium]